jgi:hypothetical protein
MDENTWNRCDRLYEMFAFAQDHLSDRKRRLFAVACCRRGVHLMPNDDTRNALFVAGRYALGLESEEMLEKAEMLAFLAHLDARDRSVIASEGVPPWSRSTELITQAVSLAASHGIYASYDAADHARRAIAEGAGWRGEQVEEVVQCRLFREMFGPTLFRSSRIDPSWMQANDRAVYRIAEEIEAGAMELYPILGDALEDAGCSDSAILTHCREYAEHVCGCWLVDLVLGR